MKDLDRISTESLVESFGSPLFVMSGDIIRSNIRKFRKSFSVKYPKTVVAYSYKANCLPGLLEIIHKEGLWAEVASGFEYELARRQGIPGESIIFNGPYKRKQELRKAIDDRANINVDNLNELKIIIDISKELRRHIEIGLRVNTEIGSMQMPDRFGFNLESGEASRIVDLCHEQEFIKIIGIHIHLASYVIEPYLVDYSHPAKNINLIWPKQNKLYHDATRKLLAFADDIRDRRVFDFKYLDLGGGFPEVNALSSYVRAIVEPIREHFDDDKPALILEPGRSIVNNAVCLITKVVGLKEFSNRKREVIIDAGINLLPTSLWRLQEFQILNGSNGDTKETIVYGPLCLQTDIIGKTDLPELEVGDHLVIKNVGAYNIPQSSTFIFPRPNIVLIDEGEMRVIRRAETIDDLLLCGN